MGLHACCKSQVINQKTRDNLITQAHSFLICGAIACPLFIITVLVEGTRRPGYNAMLYPLSSLAIGDRGWIQVLNFILAGMLLVIFSRGLHRLFKTGKVKFRGPVLIGLVGVGLIGAGIFVTDPVFGYPADKPLLLRQFTLHGHLHDAFSMVVFICLPWACFSFRRFFKTAEIHRWATYSAITGYAMIITFILSTMGFKQFPGFVDIAGGMQRVCVTIGLAWISLLSLHLLKDPHNYYGNSIKEQ